MISRSAAYALEAAIIIAERAGQRVRAGELAEELDIPANYLSKILATMARAGLMESGRGPSGGFSLGEPADTIVVQDVIGLFGEAGSTRRCFLGRSECSDAHACSVHDRWREVSAPLFEFFETTTLAELAADRGGKGHDPSSAIS